MIITINNKTENAAQAHLYEKWICREIVAASGTLKLLIILQYVP
jgi:hypothetical protein